MVPSARASTCQCGEVEYCDVPLIAVSQEQAYRSSQITFVTPKKAYQNSPRASPDGSSVKNLDRSIELPQSLLS